MTNGDIPPNSVCSKCGATNTLEWDEFDDLHCWACGTDQKDKNAVAIGRGRMKHQQIMERHKFYEDNKQAILSDVQSMGRTATCKKWGILAGSLSQLLRRWGWKEGDAITEEVAVKTDEGTNIKARHEFYEKNKDAIIADFLKMGKQPARRKWRIPKGTLPRLIEKWLSPEQVAIMNQVPAAETNISNGQLPPFPPFSALFDGPAQVKWLEVYEKLLEVKDDSN